MTNDIRKLMEAVDDYASTLDDTMPPDFEPDLDTPVHPGGQTQRDLDKERTYHDSKAKEREIFMSAHQRGDWANHDFIKRAEAMGYHGKDEPRDGADVWQIFNNSYGDEDTFHSDYGPWASKMLEGAFWYGVDMIAKDKGVPRTELPHVASKSDVQRVVRGMENAMKKLSMFGATDTEPRHTLSTKLADVFGDVADGVY